MRCALILKWANCSTSPPWYPHIFFSCWVAFPELRNFAVGQWITNWPCRIESDTLHRMGRGDSALNLVIYARSVDKLGQYLLRCFRESQGNPTACAPETRAALEEKLRASSDGLNRPPRMVHMLPPGETPNQLRTIHFLSTIRQATGWEGAYNLVVSPVWLPSLKEWTLFSDYGRSHAAGSYPLNLARLLDWLTTSGEIYRHNWQEAYAVVPAIQLAEQLVGSTSEPLPETLAEFRVRVQQVLELCQTDHGPEISALRTAADALHKSPDSANIVLVADAIKALLAARS